VSLLAATLECASSCIGETQEFFLDNPEGSRKTDPVETMKQKRIEDEAKMRYNIINKI